MRLWDAYLHVVLLCAVASVLLALSHTSNQLRDVCLTAGAMFLFSWVCNKVWDRHDSIVEYFSVRQ